MENITVYLAILVIATVVIHTQATRYVWEKGTEMRKRGLVIEDIMHSKRQTILDTTIQKIGTCCFSFCHL